LSQYRAPLGPNQMCEKILTCVDAPLGARRIFWSYQARSRVLTCVRPAERPFICRGPVWEFVDRVHFTTARSRRSVKKWFSRSCLIDYCAMPPYDLPTPSTACDRAFM
jgi:hypothetical protein